MARCTFLIPSRINSTFELLLDYSYYYYYYYYTHTHTHTQSTKNDRIIGPIWHDVCDVVVNRVPVIILF